jgi:hypothetical protein
MTKRPQGDDLNLLFVLGTGRCGSTLVHDMLAKYPRAGFVSAADERFRRLGAKGRLNALMYRSRLGDAVAAVPAAGGWVVDRFAPTEAYLALDDDVAPVLSAPSRDLIQEDVTPWLERRFRAFFAERARAQGTTMFIHKFTGWPRARFIHRVFPHARFVHIVRDGRAVANSLVQMRWWPGFHGPDAWSFGPLPDAYRTEWEAGDRSFPLLAGLQWKLLLDAFESARAEVPSSLWTEIRYEDFVQAPRDHLEGILRFAGIEPALAFDRAVERFHVYADRRESYRGELSARDNELLDAALAAHLRRHGYDTGS